MSLGIFIDSKQEQECVPEPPKWVGFAIVVTPIFLYCICYQVLVELREVSYKDANSTDLVVGKKD